MNGYVDRRRALAEAFEILGQLAEDANRLAYRAADVDDDLLSRHVERVRAAIVSAGDRTARMQRAETDALVDQLEAQAATDPVTPARTNLSKGA